MLDLNLILLAFTGTSVNLKLIFLAFTGTGFAWVPLVFGAYALGKRRVGLRFMFLFMTTEAVALSWLAWILRAFPPE